MLRPSVQRSAVPGASSLVGLAVVACGASGVAKLPSPAAPDDPDMTYPPACAGEGLVRCARACDKGDAAACLWVAQAWEEPSPRRDPERARRLMTRACKADDARACAHLGLVTTDRDRAAQLLRAACDDRYGRACVWYVARVVLAKAPFDWTAARPWLDKGCKADDALACVAMGDLLRTGAGTVADPQLARESLHRACELGSSSACDEESAGEPRLHALYNPDPRTDELAGALDGDTAEVRVRYCVGPGGEVTVAEVEPSASEVAALARRVVATWRFTPTGRPGPACSHVVFAIAAE
jgi:hypothetical protein